MKNILVINANPKTKSLTRFLSVEYANAAKEKHEVIQIDIGEMQFDSNLSEGYDVIQELEPDLVHFQKSLQWADHIAIFTPVWWGTTPAAFKGLLDRTFLPGFAFKYTKGKQIPEKLLKGRTSELIINLDTPAWWYRFFQGNAVYKQLKITTLDLVGIKNKRSTYLGPVMSAKEPTIQKWLSKVERLGFSV